MTAPTAAVVSRRALRRPSFAPVGVLAMLMAVLVFSCSSTLVKWSHAPGSVVAFYRMLLAVVLWWLVISQRWRVLLGALFGTVWMVGLVLPPDVLADFQNRLSGAQNVRVPVFGPAAPVADSDPKMVDVAPLYAGETVAQIDELRPAAELVRELAR